MGGIFYRNHLRFHRAYCAKGHLVSSTYRGDEGNNTPYFLFPVILVAGGMFLVLPFDLFLVMTAASAASFYAHVYLDKEYHLKRIEPRTLRMVQTQAAASLCPPSPRE
jgi:hypothetical protein